ncbi:hypothetical protein Q6A51_18375 [Pseudomonas sp. KFB-139]|uniref:Ig-like domain-containing protein n=1 Tax=Pseudomonas serbiensis TaxID=3064350 RepID=A0ABT9CTD6_9PSED|nr:hypothetical protein [Pseudomonas sp. KFB-138]MDO7928756.1 hypothetical protein [Pseudomonas sp. KFB-138]
MSNAHKIAEGIQKRREYMRSQVKRGGGNPSPDALLDPALVSAIIAGLPPGLLRVKDLVGDLDVQIPYWHLPIVSTGYVDVVLTLTNSEDYIIYVNSKRFMGPLDATDFPLEKNIPHDNIPHEGVFTIAYEIFTNEGTNNSSSPLTITIDRTPPYFNPDPALAFPTALIVPADFITDETFAGGVTEFVCTLPDYPGITDEDQVVVYWGPGMPDSPNAPNPAFGPVVIPADRKIPIQKSFIEDKVNGPTLVVYWLTDKAGNVSAVSQITVVDVQLGALPADLQPPEVPLGPLVDLADAHMGVTVLVPAFNNPASTLVRVKWGGTDLAPVEPGSMPRDVYVTVPWGTLKAEYLGPGEKPLEVSYQVSRGTLLFPDAPLTLGIDVDFSTIGPGNPDEPDPVNPTLAQVHLTGADGGQDHLTPSDDGKDINATTTLYTPVLPTEVLKLYWGTQETPVYEFTVANEKPGDPISFTIPWTAIEPQANNPALPMYYTINSDNGNNPQSSPPTPVNVDVLRISFEPATFPDVFVDDLGNGTLSCISLRSEDYNDPTAKFGFRVQIPADKDLAVGDEVIAVWQGYELDGTTAIPATRFTHVHPPLKQEEVDNGFLFLVEPYVDHILPIKRGFTEVTYTVTPAGGGTPVPANPMPAKQYVSLLIPGEDLTCVVPPPEPKP